MKRHPYLGYLKKLIWLLPVLLLSGCDMALFNPKGEVGVEVKWLIITALALMLLVVIPTIILTLVFAWKYRASNTEATYRPDWAHSNRIEVVMWSIPILIIIALGYITYVSTHSLDPYRPLESEARPVTIQVVALDWKWLFIYPEYGVATVNEIRFPVDTPVNFRITSDSVMNAFFIPRLGSMIYAMSGMQTKLHLIANEPGSYQGISANYSGAGFSGMKFQAVATPDEASFEQWIEEVKAAPQALTLENYPALAEPSSNVAPTYYNSVDSSLFGRILMKHHASPEEAATLFGPQADQAGAPLINPNNETE